MALSLALVACGGGGGTGGTGGGGGGTTTNSGGTTGGTTSGGGTIGGGTTSGGGGSPPTLTTTETNYPVAEGRADTFLTLVGSDADGNTVRFTKAGADAAHFNLDMATGELRFASAPDFENPRGTPLSGGNTNTYNLSVQATSTSTSDSGSGDPNERESAALALTITVTPVDEDPTLAIAPGPYNLVENSTAVIATLTGADPDQGDVVRFIKSGGADATHFTLDDASGELTFASAPDFENPRGAPLAADNTNTYNLSVQVTSTSTSGSGSGADPNERRSAALDLTIRVTPVDEDPPRITAAPGLSTYNFLAGTTGAITTFTLEDTDAGATDAGAGTGGEDRRFEVLGGTGAVSGLFSLAPTATASETANLTFVSAATTGTSELTITAISGGQMATLPITVVVSNDQTPSLRVATFDVDENSTPNLQLSAPDPDGADIDVTLSLLPGLDGALFALDNIVPGEASATLRFINPPDYEAPQDIATTMRRDPANNNVYLVNIQASSLGLAGNTVNITQTIRVTVTNLDDNSPTLTTTQTNYRVPENTTTTIVNLTGADADGDVVRFTKSGADEAHFTLGESSGALSFASAPDFDAPRGEALSDTNTNSYRLSVRALSGAAPNEMMSAPLSLTVTVVADTMTLTGDAELQLSSSVPANRAAEFIIQQHTCTAASGVCCVMDAIAENYHNFGRLAPTVMDRSRIRYLLPPLPTEGTLSLTLRAASGQTCQTRFSSDFGHISGAESRQTISAPGALGMQSDLSVSRINGYDYLIDVSRRDGGVLAANAVVLTLNYERNPVNNSRFFSSLHYAPSTAPDQLLVTGVDAHKYALVTFDYLKSVLDLDSYDDRGASMISWTDIDRPTTTITINNCGVPFEREVGSSYNASWVGRLVLYTPVVGDYPHALSAALDVVAHEWGHAVSNAAVSGVLAYERESGALSEAYSDWLGVAVEQSVERGAPDWMIGEEAVNGGLRSLQEPKTFEDPDTYQGEFWKTTSDDPNVVCDAFCNDNCGVHTNSGVGNKMFYLLATGGTHNGVTVTGIGITKAIQIATHAVSTSWTSNITYQMARVTMIEAAADLFAPSTMEQAQVRLAWDAVRVLP